jgi:hypothetical protein
MQPLFITALDGDADFDDQQINLDAEAQVDLAELFPDRAQSAGCDATKAF